VPAVSPDRGWPRVEPRPFVIPVGRRARQLEANAGQAGAAVAACGSLR